MIFHQMQGKCQGYDSKSGREPHCNPPGDVASHKRLINIAYFQFAKETVWVQNRDSLRTKVFSSLYTVQGNLDTSFDQISRGPQADFKIDRATISPF